MELFPLQSAEVLDLSVLGVQGPFGLNSVALSSERWLCAQDTTPGGTQVALVNIASKTLIRRAIAADACAIHPNGHLLALRSGRTLQIFDLRARCRLKTAELVEDTVFLWKWLQGDILAIVTRTAVLHWNTAESSEPVKMMTQHARLQAGIPINYRVNDTLEWLMLITVSVSGNRVMGCSQIQSVAKGCFQISNAVAACFVSFTMPLNSNPSGLLAFVSSTEAGADKLCIAFLGAPKPNETKFLSKTEALELTGSPGDFPVTVEADSHLGIVFVMWKSGFVGVHDVESGSAIFGARVAAAGLFTSVPCAHGFLALNTVGQLTSITLSNAQMVPYLQSKGRLELAFRLAQRWNLPVADQLIVQWFEVLIGEGRHNEATLLAASSQQNTLRTPATLERLQKLSGDGNSWVLIYFGELLDRGRLSAWEAVELCRPAVKQSRSDLVAKWLREDRLECSEELGDLLVSLDTTLALSVYLRAGITLKVITCFAQTGDFQNLFEYAEKVAFRLDIPALVAALLPTHPEKAVSLAMKALEKDKWESRISDVDKIVDLFIDRKLNDESIALLTEAVANNCPGTSALQTRLICLQLQRAPHIADALIANGTLTHFDQAQVARLCEQTGLIHRAFQLYTELHDQKRLLLRAESIDLNHLLAFFSSVYPSQAVDCISTILAGNGGQNIALSIQVAASCYPRVPAADLTRVFEDLKEYEGMFQLLNKLIHVSDDEDVHYMYVVTAVMLGKWWELETFCRSSNSYNPIKVRNFLMEGKPGNLGPLMIVCDRFNSVDTLVSYLTNWQLEKELAYFVSNVNRSRLTEVLRLLLESHAEDKFVLAVVTSAENKELGEVIAEVEKNSRLPILFPWLETMLGNGCLSVPAHTAFAKILVLMNRQPEDFIQTNSIYDCKDVGRFCEFNDPELAILAYSRGGQDEDLMRVCEEAGLMKCMARHLLHRSDSALWLKAFESDSPKRAALAESVTQLVTTETFLSEEISQAVKALLAADMSKELLQLLETLVFDCPEFVNHRNLQNLLILSAIKTDPARVRDLIDTLQDYDAPEVASIAQKNGLFEEAFAIYERCGAAISAMDVLLLDLADLDRATEFAERCNDPQVWTCLGQARLGVGDVELAVDAFVRAGDASNYQRVVQITSEAGLWSEQLRYLEAARKTVKEPAIDASLMFAYCKAGRIVDLERMISDLNLANIQQVAERCFVDGLLEPARVLFASIHCHGRLAETLALLGDLTGAVASAFKAANPLNWLLIMNSALSKGDQAVASIAARQLAILPDQTGTVVDAFVSLGFVTEIVTLLESLSSSDQANSTVFTELALLYIRHEPEKCQAYLEAWWTRVHVSRVLRVLEEQHLWWELALMFERHQDCHEAVAVMLAHPTEAWHHTRFKNLLAKVINSQMVQQVVALYIEYKPLLLNDVLLSLGTRLDASRVVVALSFAGHLPLCRAYLESRLSQDNRAVNDALCQLLLQEEDWQGLFKLLPSLTNIDVVSLASQLETHSLIGFRVISKELFRRCHRWTDALRVCQRDGLHREAIAVAEESGDRDLVKNLIIGFLKQNRTDSFSAALLHCYHLIQPDVVIELAWRYDAWHVAMPYLIQAVYDLSAKMCIPQEENEDNKIPSLRMLTWSPAK